MENSHIRSTFGAGVFAFIGGMVAWAFFGPKIKQRLNRSTAWNELKAEITDELGKAKDVTQSRYEQVVDEVASRYARLKNISNHELQDLIRDLKMHWSKIKSALSKPV